ncbi:MAG: sulfotransferase, partial [Chloroflexota bacterium]
MNNHSLTPSSIRFLIVGAEKSGTTWLADMLRQHPQVFIPAQKELHYFNRAMDEAPDVENYNFTKPAEWYLEFFREAEPGKILGE